MNSKITEMGFTEVGNDDDYADFEKALEIDAESNLRLRVTQVKDKDDCFYGLLIKQSGTKPEELLSESGDCSLAHVIGWLRSDDVASRGFILT